MAVVKMRLAAFLLAPVAVLAFVAAAGGERTQSGNVVVFLHGGIAPLKLPRDRQAPVAIHLSGGLETANSATLPRVTSIEVGLSSRGSLSVEGLPTCPLERLRNRTTSQAVQACPRAIVGRGEIHAQVLVENQGPLQIDADLVAFNGPSPGRRPVLLMHGYTSAPPTSVVIPFRLVHRSGAFGNVLVGRIPKALGPWPHAARFHLKLFRRFRHDGRLRSYLNASCPVAKRFTAGFLALASTTYVFAGGKKAGAEIVRGCRSK